ncbi:MAG: hypothetical protein IT423_16735 [Pirellulaceae bacterium]|nr:hypothetical protein [Pirellulaceae bacterium]
MRLLPSGQEDSTFSRLNNSFSGIFQGMVLAADGSFIVAGMESGLVFKKGLPSGLPDLTFGENGTMRIVPGPSSDTSSGSALQADGKLVMAGMTNGNLGVMRYAADGAFDATFGNEGRSTLPAPVGYILYSVADVVVSNNGFITVAGTFRKSDVAQYDLFLARLKSDGTLDTAFGQQGFVITDLGAEEHAVDMLLQADGKLVLAANQYQAGWRANLVRYNFDGSLDTSFAQDGVSLMATGGAYLNRILLQPDNRILAGGFLNFGSGISRSLLTRFKANGAVDGSFGVNGKVVEVRGPIDTVTDIALATDGTIYVTGGNLMVQRYSRDGVRDTSISWSPYQLQVPFDFRTETRSGINPQLILQSDGLILSGNFGDRSLVVAFRMNGALDERFSGDGKWIATTATRGDVKLNKLLLQRDGRLLATGTYTDTHADFVAYRFAASNRPTVTTTVAMNANGQLEISDRWSHDDQWRFGRTDTSLIVTDLSTDRRVKFTVVGLPEITGNETKQIVIPLSLLDQTRQSLIINSQGGDDKFTFSNQFNAPTFGMSIRAGAGSDTFDLSNQAVPINWVLSNATSGSARPLTRTPMTFAGVEKLVGGTNTDTFRLTYQGSADRLVIDGGGGNLDAIQLIADQDMSFATIRWPNDSLHLTVGRDQPQLYAMQNIEKATFTAGASDNWLDFSGFPGTLTVFAGAGNDTIFSGSDRSVIYGQAGNDIVFGSAQSDRLIGGDGDDVLIGSSGNDQLYGDAGKDILVGSAGADRLLGGDGNDILIGGFCSAIEALPKSRVRTLVTDTWTTAPSYALGYHYLAVLGVGRNLLKLTVGSTVLSDNEVDTYFGQADLDWFLLDAAKELNASPFGLRDQQVGERVSI